MPPRPLWSSFLVVCLASTLIVSLPAARAAFVEICDNCVDDDADGLVDRADTADCRPLANGGNAGLGDLARGKALFKCQKAIEKAGLAFSSKRLKRGYGCVLPAFACVQTKSGNEQQGCLTAAGAKCAKQAPGAAADREKLIAIIGKACDPALVTDADLDAGTGLGFLQEEGRCDDENTPTGETIGGLASCIAAQHVCKVDRTLSAGIPRARELFIAMGFDPDTQLPCLEAPPGSDGGGQNLADLGKATVKCQAGITKASLKLGSSIAKAFQKCLDLGTACLQLKDGAPPCITAAQAKCKKLSDKIQDEEKGTLVKIVNGAAKACAGISTAQLKSAAGLGFGAQSDRCGALGAAPFGTFGTIGCAGIQQFCDGKQMLTREIPRFQELSDLLGIQILGL